MITADGHLTTLTREKDGDRFNGAVVSLGTLGVVTRITLDLKPTSAVRQHIYRNLPLTDVYKSFDDIMGAGYSVSLFPTWRKDDCESVWVKHVVHEHEPNPSVDLTLFNATLVEDHVWDPSDRYLTPTNSVGPWHQRLPHFYFKDADLEGDELQSEYFVARQHAAEALKATAGFREQLEPINMLGEIRTVAADDLWLSTAYGQDVVAIHFNWHKDWEGVCEFLPKFEEALAPFEPRPHWGKLFELSPGQVQARYPRLDDFRDLAKDLDPDGKFRNAYVEKYIFGA